MQIKNPDFELTAIRPEHYPQKGYPELALLGRSNVGKSSLINTIFNRKGLARVGKTPGKTREVNFYNIDNKLFLVDLPGYGFAKVSKEEQKTWKKMVESYLFTRQELKLLVLLVDVRHTPTQDDIVMHRWLQEMDKNYAVVVTKCDKITKVALRERLKDIKNTLKLSEDVTVIPFSSETRMGKDELIELIGKETGVE